MKFSRDETQSRIFHKDTYTCTGPTGGLVFLFPVVGTKWERKAFRKTGKAVWYVKTNLDLKPDFSTVKMLTKEEACEWAENELFPTRLALLFMD